MNQTEMQAAAAELGELVRPFLNGAKPTADNISAAVKAAQESEARFSNLMAEGTDRRAGLVRNLAHAAYDEFHARNATHN